MQAITGAMTALITPYKNDKIDEETYARLIQRQIDNKIDAVVPVGTTGESATLDTSEHKQCVQIAVDVCKGTNTKVIAGAGSNNTKESIDLAKFAQKVGADGVLSVVPYYNKPNKEGLYQHYKAIADSIDISVMLYNVPGRTAVDMSPDVVLRLVNDVENINSIKEATGSMDRCVELLVKSPDLCVISGDDMLNYPLVANGAKGCISVTSNILPRKIVEVIHYGLDGEFEKSKAVNNSLYNINRLLFADSNPIPIKTAMHIAGLLPNLEFRLPLVMPSKELIEKLEKELENFKGEF